MELDTEYELAKEESKDKYRLVKVENKHWEYQIEYAYPVEQNLKTVIIWLVLYRIDYRKPSFINFILQNYTTYEEQAKKEFINQMRVLNQKENKSIV